MKKNYNKDILDWTSFPTYDMIWCDPPWEQSMVKMFQTIMKKDVGKTVDHTIDEILHHLGKLADPNKPMVIEYCIKGMDRVPRVMKSHGHTLIGEYMRTQGSGRPFVIFVFNGEVPIAESKGLKIVSDSLSQVKPCTVFDPFAGIGQTAKHARKAGHTYIGSELNPKRYLKLCKANP